VTRLAVVGGHSLLGTEFAAKAARVDVDTEFGAVGVLDAGEYVVLQRHGLDRYTTAPHVNFKANVRALQELGCDRVLAIASTGGLKIEHGVGTFLAPDDFIALHLGVSYTDGADSYQTPGFDLEWRRTVLDCWAGHSDVDVVDGGVYWQTIGPRFETAAEIRLMATYADVVGMTAASEAILTRELSVSYAVVCVVDNLANGLAATPLSWEEFEAGARANRERVVGALEAVVPALVEEHG
jgi:5'-methylthioadenosine phosphorylase